MNIVEKKIKGVFEITLTMLNDDNGFFARSYDTKIFEYFGLNRKWINEYIYRNEKRGTVRGIYFQFPPYNEAKLIRCTRGAVFLVFLDLRKDSSTFAKWDSVDLSEQNKKMLFLPRGFALGSCSLSEISEYTYKSDNYYSRDHESGIVWNDPNLAIKWPVPDITVSQRDSALMQLNDFINKYRFFETDNQQ